MGRPILPATGAPALITAFTLVEMMMAIAIIAVLMGMLMPIVTLAGKAARKTSTRSIMVKVDTALRLFRSDVGPYPYQTDYADLASGAAWTNRLNYHLGTDIADADYDNLLADADAAAALYADVGVSPFAFIGNDTGNWTGAAVMANRMGAERARLVIYSGHANGPGPTLRIPFRWGTNSYTRRILPTTPMLSSPASAAKPGWAKDYLGGDLDARFIDGEAILDAWKRPLLYVCQVIEGMHSAPMMNADVDTSLILSALDMGLQPQGRTTLADVDSITGTTLTTHSTYLPDLSNLRQSDRRFYAPKGLEIEFELWSAGPDGRADWMRTATANADNVPLLPYDRDIP